MILKGLVGIYDLFTIYPSDLVILDRICLIYLLKASFESKTNPKGLWVGQRFKGLLLNVIDWWGTFFNFLLNIASWDGLVG